MFEGNPIKNYFAGAFATILIALILALSIIVCLKVYKVMLEPEFTPPSAAKLEAQILNLEQRVRSLEKWVIRNSYHRKGGKK